MGHHRTVGGVHDSALLIIDLEYKRAARCKLWIEGLTGSSKGVKVMAQQWKGKRLNGK